MTSATQIKTLNATARQQSGTGFSRRLRNANQIPAVVYGSKQPVQNIILDKHNEIYRLAQDNTVLTNLLSLSIDSKPEKVLIKSIQRHPFKKQILHIDFIRINESEAMVVMVPLKFINEETSPGVKAGGVISHLMIEIEVKCLPGDLPSEIIVDAGNVQNNETMHVSDLKIPAKVDLTMQIDDSHNPAVLTIHTPTTQEEPAEEQAEEAPTEEPPAEK